MLFSLRILVRDFGLNLGILVVKNWETAKNIVEKYNKLFWARIIGLNLGISIFKKITWVKKSYNSVAR